MSDRLRQIVAASRAGAPVAIPSVCTAHPDALEASLRLAQDLDQPLVVEATSNQVNQDGGYTGMRPADFIGFVRQLAEGAGVDAGRVHFGGDHLGPQAWRRLAPGAAMDKAQSLVAAYAAAGFTKLHLDCSEGCQGEPPQLPDAVTAARSAALAATALAAAPRPEALLFVIGTEVPPPGGARAEDHGEIPPTRPEAARATLAAHDAAFRAAGIGGALPQIAGLVVQPGVEFTPMNIHHLPMQRDPGLREVLGDWPHLCLEAHSTDYQHPQAYRRLAELGFAFQKVGPALTHAWRSAVYALDCLCGQVGWASGPPLPGVMEELMLAEPGHWQGHYRGGADELRIARHFGLADRIRYYWPRPAAVEAVARLFADLAGRPLPEPMILSQFSPEELVMARRIATGNLPRDLALARVQLALRPYFAAKV